MDSGKPCSYENHTFITYDITKPIIALDCKGGYCRLVGNLGKCIDRLLCKPEIRRCKLVKSNTLGEKLPNGSYTGSLGMLERFEADLLLKAEPEYINEPWLHKSLPITSERLSASQIINENKDVDYFNLLDNFKFDFSIYLAYSISFLLAALLCFFMTKAIIHLRKLRVDSSFNYFLKSNALQFTVFFLFFNLFIWWSILFITNQIKTNKVVVDTSELITSADKLLKSDKIVCFIENNTEINLALRSTKKSDLFRLYNEKNYLKKDHETDKNLLKGARCLIRRDSNIIITFFSFEYVFILGNVELKLLQSALALYHSEKSFWVSKPFVEYNAVIYYNDRNKLNRKFNQIFSHRLTQSGFAKQMYDCFEYSTKFMYQNVYTVYDTIDEFINDKIGFSSLDFKNFESLFIIYFLMNFLYLLAFTIHCIIIWLKNKFF